MLPVEERARTPKPDYTNRCFRDVLPAIYLPRSDDLYVTIAHDAGHFAVFDDALAGEVEDAGLGVDAEDGEDTGKVHAVDELEGRV